MPGKFCPVRAARIAGRAGRARAKAGVFRSALAAGRENQT
jgi:hypothetical protein